MDFLAQNTDRALRVLDIGSSFAGATRYRGFFMMSFGKANQEIQHAGFIHDEQS